MKVDQHAKKEGKKKSRPAIDTTVDDKENVHNSIKKDNKNRSGEKRAKDDISVAVRDSKKDCDLSYLAPQASESEPASKKRRTEDNKSTESDQKSAQKPLPSESDGPVDVCQVINLQPGMRIEVKWNLLAEADDSVQTETRWWGAKLLPHDGRMHTLSDGEEEAQDNVEVPLRVLDYDPYTEGGFPDRALAEVVFLNDHLLFEVETDTHLTFRIEGSDWDEEVSGEDEDADDDTVLSVNSHEGREEGLRTMLESILQTALANSGVSAKMKSLPAAQQLFMAEKIRASKDTLVEKMIKKIDENEDGVLTADCVRQCIQEMGNELRSM